MMQVREPVQPRYDTVMDVTEEQIARVYAKAFLGVAEKSGAVESLVEELHSVVSEVLNPFPQLEEVFRSELIPEEEKEQLIGRVIGGQVSPQVLNFLKVVARHKRLVLLRPIAREVTKLHDKNRGLANVEVRVPIELDDALRSEIENMLRRMLGVEPVLSVVIDPGVIAGFVLRAGDRVYDASVHRHLELLRRSMVDRVTERIEVSAGQFLTD